MNELWYISWVEYNGYDCFGHQQMNLYNGTYEEALEYANSRNEDKYEKVIVKEFDMEWLNRKGVVF
jgi:hypothetical protein